TQRKLGVNRVSRSFNSGGLVYHTAEPLSFFFCHGNKVAGVLQRVLCQLLIKPSSIVWECIVHQNTGGYSEILQLSKQPTCCRCPKGHPPRVNHQIWLIFPYRLQSFLPVKVIQRAE